MGVRLGGWEGGVGLPLPVPPTLAAKRLAEPAGRGPAAVLTACHLLGRTSMAGAQLAAAFAAASSQMTSPGGRSPNLLCHHLHSGYWKLVRKGVAPAFNPRNIRWAQLTGEQVFVVMHALSPGSCPWRVSLALLRRVRRRSSLPQTWALQPAAAAALQHLPFEGNQAPQPLLVPQERVPSRVGADGAAVRGAVPRRSGAVRRRRQPPAGGSES